MKAMIFSDLITSKNVAVQLLLVSVVICGFLAWGTNETIVGTAAMATMTPMMYLFSIFAYDEMNGWERFRLTLPITKRQVAYGRYISMLIIAVISLLAAWIVSFAFLAIVQACGGLGMGTELVNPDAFIAILDCGFAGFIFIIVLASLTLPLLMRFGMNKATRLLAAPRCRHGRACECRDRQHVRRDRFDGHTHVPEREHGPYHGGRLRRGGYLVRRKRIHRRAPLSGSRAVGCLLTGKP